MSRLNRTNRAGAMLLWLFFTAVTAYTLLADVVRGAEPFTTGHLLSVAALVAALAAGHHAWPELRSGRLPVGIGLAVVAVAATGYVVLSAAARNAETAHAKSARIEASNTAREAETRQLRMAEAMLAEALKRVAAECASGNGTRCKGAQATEHVYRAAIDGHKARLDRMAPALPPNGGYAHAAKFLAALPGITAPAEAIERRLVETVPTLSVLITELAALVFGIMAFRAPVTGGQPGQHPGLTRTNTRTVRAITERPEPFTTEEIDDLKRIVKPDTPNAPPGADKHPARNRTVRRTVNRKRTDRPNRPSGGKGHDESLADLLTLIALGQSVPSQESLSVRWNRPKQTVSDWLRTWESDGLIPARRQTGRTKMLSP